MPGKRESYLNWDEYFMGLAILSSMRSKDPHNQVGACIVEEESKKILSIGYNGLTKGMSDDLFDWNSSGEITGNPLNIKDFYIVHAERNAILNYRGNKKDLEGSTMYVTWSPCTECVKEIVQVGIKKVYYLREFSKEIQKMIGRRMLDSAGVECIPYNREREITKEEVVANTEAVQKVLKSFSKR